MPCFADIFFVKYLLIHGFNKLYVHEKNSFVINLVISQSKRQDAFRRKA